MTNNQVKEKINEMIEILDKWGFDWENDSDLISAKPNMNDSDNRDELDYMFAKLEDIMEEQE